MVLSNAANNQVNKVVCFGDSITKRGYPEILARELNCEVINAGVAGHTSRQGLQRMKKDVLNHRPTTVVILFGTNDLRVDSHKHVAVKDYSTNLSQMVTACEKSKKRGRSSFSSSIGKLNGTQLNIAN